MILTLDTEFNIARKTAFDALLKTLDDAFGKPVTEIEFRNLWLRNISAISNGAVIASGWYNPPPYGSTVLFGRENDPSRISFTSLRKDKFHPKNKNIADWENGFVYAYCSPVHMETGIIGDVSICLYFGKDKRLQNHFNNAFDATTELLTRLPEVSNSGQLLALSKNVFPKYNLINNIHSINDPTNDNIGHTFPSIGPLRTKVLTREQKKHISGARKFINGDKPFEFTDGMQFTIEPQLTSTLDSMMPKVTIHYLVIKVPGGFRLCNDVDILFKKDFKCFGR